MSRRDSYWLDDLLSGTPLTATSSIYPATPAATPMASSQPRRPEAGALLPWGCSPLDQLPQLQA